jgi:hypothetical protein
VLDAATIKACLYECLSLPPCIQALGYNFLELPPELHPESFPELLIAGADSPLHKFDNEVGAWRLA